MTDTEMRELDDWIHRQVMRGDEFVGLKKRGLWYRPMALGYTDKQSEAGRYTRSEAMKHECPHGEPVTIHEFEPEKYCTDPAASFELLKKCAEKIAPECGSVAIAFESDIEEWTVQETDKYRGVRTTAKTIELAIAKFARKLYSK